MMTSVRVVHELFKKQLANSKHCKNIFYISHNNKWRSLASKLLTTNYTYMKEIYVLNHSKLIEEIEFVISKYMVPN
jgi:hypothetical protein